jgi:2-hydroxycyclohexanecarboxyl-CoA dehydrogenase
MSLQGKIALVTGGARGIGKAIALRLAQDGAGIGILDRDGEAAAQTAAEIGRLGVPTGSRAVDITDYEATKQAVGELHDELVSVDILINNAGIDKAEFFINTDSALWDRLIDVNYKGFLNATHVTIPYMMEQQGGCIVSLGSDAGRVGNSGEVVYCGTKAAIMASSKALARELARYNVRVNCVSPGPVQTELLAGLHEGEKGAKIMEAVAKAIPMKRIGVPEDVARVVSFLVGEDSGYLTGQVISVDGGLTMIG